MKKNFIQKIAFSFGALLLTLPSYSQYSWTQKASFTGAARDYSAGFSIGRYGFIGLGYNTIVGYTDFYKWSQASNTWTAIANYPGGGQESPIAFSIGGYGYVGLGYGSSVNTDLWRYDTATNTWTQMASLPGAGRYDETWFVIGHKAYIIGGSPGGTPYLQDVWMYDSHQNTWTQMNNSPLGKFDGGVGFAIGNHGYVVGGDNGLGGATNSCYEYDTTSDTWSAVNSFPISNTPTGDARAFVIGSKAYVCTGTVNTGHTLSTGYVYDTVTKAWSEFTNMGTVGIERGYCAAFSIGQNGYIGTGKDSLGNLLTSFWQYGTTTGIEEIRSSVNINLYPNPNNGMMNLVYTGNIQNGEIQIIDLTGRVIDTREMKGSKGQLLLNESALMNGMYFYQVIDAGKLISSGKFIIAK